MNERAAFYREQRAVARRMAAAIAVTAAVLTTVGMANAGETVAFSDRLGSALQKSAFIVIWLAVAIANVARLRFFSSHDIGGSSSSAQGDEIRIASAILQNTFEQVVLAVLAQAILAATLPDPDLFLFALVVLFSVGRSLFWLGYRHGASGRAFGFALTFYPSIAALIFAMFLIVSARAA